MSIEDDIIGRFFNLDFYLNRPLKGELATKL